jgi:preprotein translocase subunit SecD
MKVCAQQFNLYLAFLAIILVACGCQTSGKDKDKDAVAALRIHIESPKNLDGTGQPISFPRVDPVVINILNEPILTEASVAGAKLVDTSGGGFAVAVQFDETGSFTLEQFSAANPGRHFVVFGQWGKKLSNGRWLAAPLITNRIHTGELIFTPDASREEATELVKGLQNVAHENSKGIVK